MAMIAVMVFLVLEVVALVHICWALGMSWPAEKREQLGAMVVGTPIGVAMPPAWLTLLVAIGISLLGGVSLWGVRWFSLGMLDIMRRPVLLAATFVFCVRGVATYAPFGILQASAEPFRTLDKRYFAPLCLLLAIGYVAIYVSL